jgi:hypothetical protein
MWKYTKQYGQKTAAMLKHTVTCMVVHTINKKGSSSDDWIY